MVLDEINEELQSDYQMKDIKIVFEREVMTNAKDNAEIKLTEAQEQQVRINTLLSLADTLDDETVLKNICDCLDIDYEEVKDKIPDPDEGDNTVKDAAKELSRVVIEDESAAEGSLGGTVK